MFQPAVRLGARPVSLMLAMILATASCGGGGNDKGSDGKAVKVTDGTVIVGAFDVYFDVERIEVATGELAMTLEQKGNQAHTLVIEGNDEFKLSVVGGGEPDSGTVNLKPGEFEYFCDIPGHRGQGMLGTLVVT